MLRFALKLTGKKKFWFHYMHIVGAEHNCTLVTLTAWNFDSLLKLLLIASQTIRPTWPQQAESHTSLTRTEAGRSLAHGYYLPSTSGSQEALCCRNNIPPVQPHPATSHSVCVLLRSALAKGRKESRIRWIRCGKDLNKCVCVWIWIIISFTNKL